MTTSNHNVINYITKMIYDYILITDLFSELKNKKEERKRIFLYIEKACAKY